MAEGLSFWQVNSLARPLSPGLLIAAIHLLAAAQQRFARRLAIIASIKIGEAVELIQPVRRSEARHCP
jgi:hypothetical protein